MQQVFFLTRLDILRLMEEVDNRVDIEYIPLGTFNISSIKGAKSISEFIELGTTSYGCWMSLDNRYMLLPSDIQANYRTVTQRDGSFRYVIDLSSNLSGVELSTGGVLRNVENVFIAGRLAVYPNSSERAIHNYKIILSLIKKLFIKRGRAFISGETLSLLREGWRLTCNVNSPREYDLL